jgi:hypothetical protein
LSTTTLSKALSTLVRPLWDKGNIDKHVVACMAAIGKPGTLKGLGLSHPEALDGTEKACALLRLLNTPNPAGIAALAIDGMRAHMQASEKSQTYPKSTAKYTRIPATHTGGMAALGKAPAGEAAWTIAENYREFALCSHPDGRPLPSSRPSARAHSLDHERTRFSRPPSGQRPHHCNP